MTVTTTSCPRCGAGAPAQASRCRDCGFVFFEEPPRRSLPRPSLAWLVSAVLVLLAVGGSVLLLTRDGAPDLVEPVAAASAEARLERQVRRGGSPQVGSVRCAGTIRPTGTTRCQLLYSDGDTQLMLVRLLADGRLDIDVPYPAQRRPGG